MTPPDRKKVFAIPYAQSVEKRAQPDGVQGPRIDPSGEAVKESTPSEASVEVPKVSGEEITGLLQQWRGGSREAFDRLIPLVYNELRVIASRRLGREWRDNALQTTVLVNEAYLKLVGQRAVDWQNRAHFFAIAAQLMRRIVVDDARRRLSQKRGSGGVTMPLDDLPAREPSVGTVDVLALDAALGELERLDPDQGRLVELRFFGGMTVEETAEVLGLSPATVKREWAVAKGWLHRALTRGTS
jgi:RNA polymerase sigma-70 factor (ECF subfamily)